MTAHVRLQENDASMPATPPVTSPLADSPSDKKFPILRFVLGTFGVLAGVVTSLIILVLIYGFTC